MKNKGPKSSLRIEVLKLVSLINMRNLPFLSYAEVQRVSVLHTQVTLARILKGA